VLDLKSKSCAISWHPVSCIFWRWSSEAEWGFWKNRKEQRMEDWKWKLESSVIGWDLARLAVIELWKGRRDWKGSRDWKVPLPRNSLHGRNLGSRLFCPRIQESRAKFELNWKVPLSRNSLHGRDLGSRLFCPLEFKKAEQNLIWFDLELKQFDLIWSDSIWFGIWFDWSWSKMCRLS